MKTLIILCIALVMAGCSKFDSDKSDAEVKVESTKELSYVILKINDKEAGFTGYGRPVVSKWDTSFTVNKADKVSIEAVGGSVILSISLDGDVISKTGNGSVSLERVAQ